MGNFENLRKVILFALFIKLLFYEFDLMYFPLVPRIILKTWKHRYEHGWFVADPRSSDYLIVIINYLIGKYLKYLKLVIFVILMKYIFFCGFFRSCFFPFKLFYCFVDVISLLYIILCNFLYLWGMNLMYPVRTF